MDTPTFVGSDELRGRLPWPRVIDELEAAAAAFADSRFVDRTAITTEHGQMLIMPAVSAAGVGIKLVGIGDGNAARGLPRINALYVLFDPQTLAPAALLDGTTLTAIRTAGQSAMAVARISRPDAHRLVVFGTGPQAEEHARAISAVRPIDQVTFVGRRPGAGTGTPDDVADADIVVCATNSATPVFDGRRLPEQVCVVAIGSHTPQARELDDETFRHARLVLVEHRATALREAGDVIQALEAGALDDSRLRDFSQLDDVGPGGVVVYKSVGMAYQDLALASAAVRSPGSQSSPGSQQEEHA